MSAEKCDATRSEPREVTWSVNHHNGKITFWLFGVCAIPLSPASARRLAAALLVAANENDTSEEVC